MAKEELLNWYIKDNELYPSLSTKDKVIPQIYINELVEKGSLTRDQSNAIQPAILKLVQRFTDGGVFINNGTKQASDFSQFKEIIRDAALFDDREAARYRSSHFLKLGLNALKQRLGNLNDGRAKLALVALKDISPNSSVFLFQPNLANRVTQVRGQNVEVENIASSDMLQFIQSAGSVLESPEYLGQTLENLRRSQRPKLSSPVFARIAFLASRQGPPPFALHPDRGAPRLRKG